MKTFNEAFNELLESQCFEEAIAFREDQHACQAYLTFFEERASVMAQELFGTNHVGIQRYLRANLRAAFTFGMLTGMKMNQLDLEGIK